MAISVVWRPRPPCVYRENYKSRFILFLHTTLLRLLHLQQDLSVLLRYL